MESFRLDLSKYNNTSNNIQAEFVEIFSSPFIEDPENWELSIDRFRIPLTNIPCFVVSNNTDHWIRIETNDVITASGSSFESFGLSYLPLSSSFPYMSPSDFVSAVNKSFALAHQSLLDNFYPSFISTTTGNNIA